MKKNCRILMLSLLAIIGFAALMFATWSVFLKDNIHTVKSDILYRSAQLSPSKLGQVIDQYGIRTVINLRGSHPKLPWYTQELGATRQHHAIHYDVALRAYLYPQRVQLRKLIDLLQQAPRPILLHCQGGADRTGLSVAIFTLLEGGTVNEARQAISWKYFAFSKRTIGKRFLDHYAKWLSHQHLASSRSAFLAWVGDVHFPRAESDHGERV